MKTDIFLLEAGLILKVKDLQCSQILYISWPSKQVITRILDKQVTSMKKWHTAEKS